MSRRMSFVAVAGVLIVVSRAWAQEEAHAPAEPALSAEVERLLNWLPPDTETLIVAQQPWQVQNLEEVMMELDPEATGAAETQELLGVMFSIMPANVVLGTEVPGAMEELTGKEVLLAVEGSRAFAAPAGLGGGTFEGCQIVIVGADAYEALGKIMQRCKESAVRIVEHAGVEAFAVEQETEDGTTTLFFCRPEEAMLLCASDEAYLKQTLERRTQKEFGERALPSSLVEWKHVNVRAAVWGLRHYRPEPAKDDRSSPRHAQPSIPMRDDKAVGFTFAFEPKSDVMATLVHVSPAENAAEKCRKAWSVVNPNIELQVDQAGPEAVRVSLPTHDPFSAVNCWVMVMAYFGHVVNF